MKKEDVEKVAQERWEEHGDPTVGHTQLGQIWAGMLGSYLGTRIPDLPPHLVELMMVAQKVHRAARRGPRNPDDYEDARAYLGFAEHDSALDLVTFTRNPIRIEED